ncbi:replication initiator protein A [Brucella pituitosa]|uniref:replication initiator protein A n=1 Tax=Brucella pituitosa TaxID=571256 RepID=UPI003F4A9FC3
MVGEITKYEKSPLLPERNAQGDFFVCDIFDAVPKGDMASMEHPLFSLSTKPDRGIRRYEHNGIFVEITPSVLGLATIHDRDVLIFTISQIMAALNDGKEVSQVVRFKAYDLLNATNRVTDGRGYEGLKAALDRLSGTRISTNIITGDVEVTKGFGLIESYEIARATREGRMQEVEIKLSDWVFNAIRHNEVLTLHRDYFRLRKPLERRMYELARKHCGKQKEWKISLDLLRKKCGSASTKKEFKRLIQNIVEQDTEHGHMPDYAVFLDEQSVVFKNRGTMEKEKAVKQAYGHVRLDPEALHDARTVAQGWDVYHLEQEWRNWMADYDIEPPRDAGKAFIGFCRKWVEKRGRP